MYNTEACDVDLGDGGPKDEHGGDIKYQVKQASRFNEIVDCYLLRCFRSDFVKIKLQQYRQCS